MKVCLLLRLWNEEFFLPVLEQMLKKFSFADGIIINEGKSTDRTVEIISSWEKTIFQDKYFEIMFDQEEHKTYFDTDDEGYWYNKMIKRAEELNFTYVILLDADEIYSNQLIDFLTAFFQNKTFACSVDGVSFCRINLIKDLNTCIFNKQRKNFWEEKTRIMNIQKLIWRHPTERGLHIPVFPFEKYTEKPLKKLKRFLKPNSLFTKLILFLFSKKLEEKNKNIVEMGLNYPVLHLHDLFEERRNRAERIKKFLDKEQYFATYHIPNEYIPSYLEEWYVNVCKMKEKHKEKFYSLVK